MLVTAVSFFYIRGGVDRGFPFTFAKETPVVVDGNTDLVFSYNYWLLAFDVIIWWLLFSVLWIIVKNYILELDG
jgi:hypothetical protein